MKCVWKDLVTMITEIRLVKCVYEDLVAMMAEIQVGE